MACTILVAQPFTKITGFIDESADFTPLIRHSETLKIDFEEVTGLNGFGVLKIIQLVNKRSGFGIEFHKCPRIMIDTFNTVESILGPKKDPGLVKSFFFPYYCQPCDTEHDMLVPNNVLEQHTKTMSFPTKPCPNCGLIMRLEQDPKEYLSFLLAGLKK